MTASSARSLSGIVVFAIGLIFVLQIWLIFNLNINWDEFYFLALVEKYQQGTLEKALQTFHVHLFGWLTLLPLDEIGKVITGRMVMLICEIGTTAIIFAISRRLANPLAASLAVLAYLAGEYTLPHGMSFRADAISAFLLMVSIYLLMVSSLSTWRIALAGASGALAVLITIKSGLYLPVFFGAVLWRATSSKTPTSWGRIAGMAIIGVICLIGFYCLHSAQVIDDLHTQTAAQSAFKKTLATGHLFPNAEIVKHWAVRTAMPLAFAVLGIYVGFRRYGLAFGGTLILFVAPLISLIFYRNAFPYFFAFLTPPIMVVSAIGFSVITKRRALLIAALLIMGATTTLQLYRIAGHGQQTQREIVTIIHKIFPEPVAYIDRNAMIGSFPRNTIFMSTWGMENYRAKGKPIMADILRQETTPLLIVNGHAIYAVTKGMSSDNPHRFLAEDAAILHENFIPHWGAIWVAGKILEVSSAPSEFTILTGGTYTLEAATPVIIDGKRIEPNMTVELSVGGHVISSSGGATVTLRWGDNLFRPDYASSQRPIYWGF